MMKSIREKCVFSISFHLLPKLLLSVIFALNLYEMAHEFMSFETVVMMRWLNPQYPEYPAITLCGCCLRQLFRNESLSKITLREAKYLKQYPAASILANHTVHMEELIQVCSFVINPLDANPRKISCRELSTVIESMQNGRKCFTLITEYSEKKYELVKNKTNFVLNMAFFLMIDLTKGMAYIDQKHDDSLSTWDVVYAVHPPGKLPAIKDVNFMRVQPGRINLVLFEKRITTYVPNKHWTRCKQYQFKSVPQSYSECVTMCVNRETFQAADCLNFQSLVTEDLLAKLNLSQVRQCHYQSKLSYYLFVEARHRCQEKCYRNCEEVDYEPIVDEIMINPSKETTDVIQKFMENQSLFILIPNGDLYQWVYHEPRINWWQLLGCLGGHAHIWLGLSAIQFYDVIARIIFSLYQCYFVRFMMVVQAWSR